MIDVSRLAKMATAGVICTMAGLYTASTHAADAVYNGNGQIKGYNNVNLGAGPLMSVSFTDGTIDQALGFVGPLLKYVTVQEGEWSDQLYILSVEWGREWLKRNVYWQHSGIVGCSNYCAIRALKQTANWAAPHYTPPPEWGEPGPVIAWDTAIAPNSHPWIGPYGITKWDFSTVGLNQTIAIWSKQ